VTVTVTDVGGLPDDPDLTLPAEALLRLVYGRLDPDHAPPDVGATGDQAALVERLRVIFPGN
jgi:hypothetical protein